jgi:hypothetical protein
MALLLTIGMNITVMALTIRASPTHNSIALLQRFCFKINSSVQSYGIVVDNRMNIIVMVLTIRASPIENRFASLRQPCFNVNDC